jgi:uncharacterized protein with PIN domain
LPQQNALALRPPLSAFHFVLDTHLGRLATYLRMLGFDTLWRADYHDPELAHISSCENRILLTRDRGLLKRSEVIYGYLVRATAPREQMRELIARHQLAGKNAPFTRCLRCNVLLIEVDKEAVATRLKLLTVRHFEHFRECPQCRRVYWEGSHHQHMQELISAISNA